MTNLSQIHLRIINVIFSFIQNCGLTLWKISPSINTTITQTVTFSYVGLIISISVVSTYIFSIIYQHSSKVAGFDTIYTTNMSEILRSMHRMTYYFLIFAVFYPVWILYKGMKHVLEKFLLVKKILMDLNEQLTGNFILISCVIKIILLLVFAVAIGIIQITIGLSITSDNQKSNVKTMGVTWITFMMFLTPKIFQYLCIAYFMTITGFIATRMNQVRSLLLRI